MSASLRNLLLVGAVLLVGFVVYRYRQPRFVAGETAPDFTATLADGQTVRLSDLRGHPVLLQFWGSWCGPCRAENPHLLELYQKYHDRGFEILSVGLENNAKAWQRAIAQDSMVWRYHTVELEQFEGPIARQYRIKQIPAVFLLNAEGVIMAVNLSPELLDKMLAAALPPQ